MTSVDGHIRFAFLSKGSSVGAPLIRMNLPRGHMLRGESHLMLRAEPIAWFRIQHFFNTESLRLSGYQRLWTHPGLAMCLFIAGSRHAEWSCQIIVVDSSGLVYTISGKVLSGDPSYFCCEGLPTNERPLSGKWSTLPNITRDGFEYPRQEHAAVLVGDEMYVLGGILPWDGKEYATTNIVQKYNMITGTWTETAPMPAALNHANVAVVDDKIYYLGGLEAVDETYWNATGKSAVYDPATDEWTVLPSMPEGREIGSAATLVVDDTIYLPGGLAYTNITYDQEGTVSRFTSYNVRTQEWTTLPDLPAPRDHAGKGIYQDMLYILGGREFGNKNVVSTVFGFNLTSHQWSTAYEPMPIARGGVASATIGSQTFMAGGEGDRRTPTAVFPEMQAYDAAKNTWIDYADMPLPIHGSDAVVYKGEIVIPGGGIVTGATLTPVVQTFKPPIRDLGEKSMTLMVMLHNLQCEYQLSKKQQTSNKPPMASTAEDVSAVPSPAENNDAGVTTLVSSPNDIQILPELTATRLGAANRVSGNAGSSLQEMMFAANDRHIMPVMFDGYAHDDFSATSIEWFGSDSQAAPFSVDMSNMSGLGKLPWSPPNTNYSETNFDIPYPIEHTTDASANLPSTSQFELNLPLSPTGPMRDIYDEKMWEEVSPKTIANGVGVKDQSPRIDFSLTAIFSPQRQRLGNLSPTQQDEVDGIFRRLSDAQSQMSYGLGSEQYDSTQSRWYWSDTALMEKYKSVMAFGFQALAARSLPSAGSEVSKKAISRLRMALSSRDAVQRSPDTLLKMQTILAMMTISEQIDDKIHTELLSYAVSCARSRRFMNRDSVYMTMAKEEEYLARRSLWYLYSMEVVHSIRHGMPPILTPDWTDYALPKVGKDTDWLLIQCQHANALSSAVNTLYSSRALCQTVAERERNLMQAHKALESWRTGLPIHLQNIHRHETGYVTLDDQKTRHLTLTMVRKYHEAIFIIFFPWTGSQSKGLISEHYRKKSMELCVKSAQAVLAIAARIASCDILGGELINLIAVSICVTFLDIVSSGSKKSLPYLTDALKLTQLAQKSGNFDGPRFERSD
ncbi:hypothetical protein CNMCM7927_006229 [Aspergillus lentulus]|nr:hypothetical protein CNMCM7927_006229 [Aspergillus lentulus]